jgi:isopentenyl-diphosphate delta-isomerase
MSDTTHDQVILVDKNDQEVGLADKLQAHKDGLLHRAISVFVINGDQVLLQQRADDKYHSADLWSNTCCSHPRPGENTLAAAKRRLQEEMGIDCELQHCGAFIYRSDYDNGLTEHELDHVFIGELVDKNSYALNPHEAKAAKWVSIDVLKDDLEQHPERYSSWLAAALANVPR